MAAPAIPFRRREGREFLDFCRRAVAIVLARPFGVDQDIFMMDYYAGGDLPSQQEQDFLWSEFKRARDHSNDKFNEHDEGWVWMRARRGLLRGQFYYQAVAKIVDGEPEIVIQYPMSERLHLEKHSEWVTRTQSEMRVTVANIEAQKRKALATGNRDLYLEADRKLDEVIVLAPRLAAINFDTGLTVSDLREIAKSPRIPRLLQKTVKKTLESYEKSQEQIKELSHVVYEISQMRKGRK